MASAPRSGRGGRKFESSHPDNNKSSAIELLQSFCCEWCSWASQHRPRCCVSIWIRLAFLGKSLGVGLKYHAKHKKDEEMRHRGLHLHSCMMCFFIDLRVACMKKTNVRLRFHRLSSAIADATITINATGKTMIAFISILHSYLAELPIRLRASFPAPVPLYLLRAALKL